MTEKAENPRAVAGNNSGDESVAIAGGELRAFVERIENVRSEKAELAEAEKDIFAELKGRGFDTKVVREVLRRRKQDKDERDEFETLLDVYEQALGVFA